jgi:hypothetical protein
MVLFAFILLGVIVISGAIILWMELSVMYDRLGWLEERLTKLEKDAVKVTFTSKPNPKQFDGVKSEEPFVKTRTKRKPKTVGEWEEEIDLGGHE